MNRPPLMSIMLCALVLAGSGCSQSPSSRFKKMCNGTDQQCECVAAGLSEALGDSEFDSFLDDLEALKNSSGDNMGPVITAKILGGGDSAKAWGAFMGAAKACGLVN